MTVNLTVDEAIDLLEEWLGIDECSLEDDDTSDYAAFVRRQDSAVRLAIKALKVCKEFQSI
jgi:hypothetical protein